MAVGRDDLAGKRPESPFHSVADNRAADFLGNGEAGAHLRVVIGAITDQKHESSGRRAPAGVGGEEVGSLPDYA